MSTPASPLQAAARLVALKGAPTDHETDPVGDLAEDMASDWQPVANMVEGPLQQLLASCKSIEEFLDRLPELIPHMDASELAEQIAQGLFAADLSGRVGAV
jgi:phage gp29-like protein